jgi:excisionase family DNA binding protein
MLGETLTVPPSETYQVRELHRILQLGTPALVGPTNERLELPETIYHLLKDVARTLMSGRGIMLIPQKQQVTTQAAANFLGVSRPHLIKLLESGKIAFVKVGQHRRILLKDLKEFQEARDSRRKTALNNLARAEYEEGGYEGISFPDGAKDE